MRRQGDTGNSRAKAPAAKGRERGLQAAPDNRPSPATHMKDDEHSRLLSEIRSDQLRTESVQLQMLKRLDESVERLARLESEVVGIKRSINRLDEKHSQTRAYVYEMNVLSWISNFLQDWWQCKPNQLYNRKYYSNENTYSAAFASAFRFLNRNANYVELHNVVNRKDTFRPFQELEFNVIGSASLNNGGTFQFDSPSRIGSKADNNILIIIETTQRGLDVGKDFLRTWLDNTDGPAAKIARYRKGKTRHDAMALLCLFDKLLQLEKQICLQLNHFAVQKQVNAQSLRNGLRVALVSTKSPSHEVLTLLFDHDYGKSTFRNLAFLHGRGHFKVLAHRTNYDDLLYNPAA